MSDYLRAIEVLEARGWHQGSLTGSDGSVCLIGAINTALWGSPSLRGRPADGVWERRKEMMWRVGVVAFADRLGDDFRVGDWNDDDHTTYEDVILALKRAHEDELRVTVAQ